MLIETTLEEMKDDSSWCQVWNIKGTSDTNLNDVLDPDRAYDSADDLSIDPLVFDDIEELLASVNGENDGEDWSCIVKMKDGRFAFVTAGCDYTGWDCQAGGRSFVAASLEELRFYCLSAREQERLEV